MIILNEKKEAERIIENGDVGSKPYKTLSLLARYYYHEKKYNLNKIIQSLDNFMKTNYFNYNSDNWINKITQYAKNAKRYGLTCIDSIPITKIEMITINSIGNKKLEKLAFTLLVLAKYGNIRNSNNNNWMTVDYNDVFKMARTVGTTESKALCYRELELLNLISFAKKPDNLNIQVNFINDDSDVILHINDMRELGYQYLMYQGENYIKCAECGILIKPKSSRQKYCKHCSSYHPVKVKKIICCDCKEEFVVNSKDNTTKRCSVCYKIYRRENNKKAVNKCRNNK